MDDWDGVGRLGAAGELRIAERGCERDFLSALRGDADWVVAFGYEFGVALLGLDPALDDAAPAFALRTGVELVLDHDRGEAELRGPSEAALDAWLARCGASLREDPVLRAEIAPWEGDPAVQSPPELQPPPELHDPPELFERRPSWRRSAAEYEDLVERCRTRIRDGDAYVLCLTDTAEIRGPRADPLDLYLRLRESGPAVRGGVIVAGERALVSASPERFLSVRGDGIRTDPIKGTRPRGATPEADAALAQELAVDPKERAENLMIVDLMRNDLSRVCVPGTVAATGFLRVETHPHVHQLVSTVSGRLAGNLDAVDAIRACFPGGSMTGAPKHRAVEILAELEGAPRGLYSGCFGWIDRSGDAELAMTIRSIELRELGAVGSVELRGLGGSAPRARVGAGGGITVDSDPARERAEKSVKAAPLLRALGAGGAGAR
ncbi:anthranilate synthase component I family protein [Leucobacter weissii]|uniref:Anthranilate synthase component I family protein n=1 Tax=Leucobacter weissii TaxID=1983706 RepID=A0A939MN36_9MICO|nr:anthranilate synthase component I family protein [Leucobacter weissii]